jgi:hypothetical protein
MTKQELLHTMCLELSQADLKAIGQSRGFDPQTVASRELLQHVFFSEQGVQAALASLAEAEVHGLHLLNCLGNTVELDFFKPVYPGLVPAGYYRSFTESHRAIFQKIKTQLVRRGILVCGTLPKGFDDLSVVERTRLIFPEEFAVFLPAPFRPRQLGPGALGQCRENILRDKLKEISQLDSVPAGAAARREPGQWRLADGELLFGGKPFRVLQLEAWWLAQVDVAVSYKAKEQADALQPVPLLRYAFSRLRENEWLAPDDLVPFWKMALPGPKAPTPRTVCEAGYEWGCFERIEQEGGFLYRQPRLTESVAKISPEDFLDIGDAQHVRINLERVPFEILEIVAAVSRLKLAQQALWAAPDLLRLSHASADTLADPALVWLQERHPAFGNTSEAIQQRRGKLILHENLLLARVSDLSLKVLLEKKFGEPGQLVALSKEFVAFPNGLMPEIKVWLKKSGHVVKSIDSGEILAEET